MIHTLDCETYLILPGCLTPKMVSCAIDEVLYHHTSPSLEGVVVDILTNHNAVGHNITFDLAVLCRWRPSLLPLVFGALEEGRVHCTMLREQLIQIAEGTYNSHQLSLAGLVKKYHGEDISHTKSDGWRLKYSLLDDVPIDQWPEEAVEYAVDDTRWTRAVYDEQEGFPFGDQEAAQLRAAWSLHLMSVWGLRCDPEAVKALRARLEADVEEHREMLTEARVLRPGGSKDLKRVRELVELAYKGDPPKTSKGNTATSADVLEKSGCPILRGLAAISTSKSELNKDIPVLESGTRHPVCARYNVLVRSGRTSCRAPNLQNLSRRPGVRECFIPREGRVFISVDFDSLELRTWSQACLDICGYSTLAHEYQKNPDFDPHLYTAASILKTTYEELLSRRQDKEAKRYRSLSKIPNFGLPGGMGPASLSEYAYASFRIEISEGEARELTDIWKITYPEHEQYFRHIREVSETGTLVQLRSDRIRGGVGYCDAANSYFQGLAADGCKESLWRASKACYIDKDSPLYGSNLVVFVHDEIIAEVPFEGYRDAAAELIKIMEESMQIYTPDVPIRASATAMRRWSKDKEGLDL